eukprot:CAMPEP_0198490172 /NCGR_PEP_ID=MMETSP1462-20131121/1935_1 /TAXON_ID=1333877 /ORGANISM="Brandtodinium nutriculum, Strain RCC3387" /LENGTH=105 /DNA_ID=CAMNT_0044218709 /DNA_START=22 /DNA_END=337 /DNA_ORIENTATION=+
MDTCYATINCKDHGFDGAFLALRGGHSHRNAQEVALRLWADCRRDPRHDRAENLRDRAQTRLAQGDAPWTRTFVQTRADLRAHRGLSAADVIGRHREHSSESPSG